MKSFIQIKTIILVTLISLFGSSVNATEGPKKETDAKLAFMKSMSLEKVQEYALIDKKPILLFFNSKSCMSSRAFTREVVANGTIKTTLKKHFVCMNADVSTKEGKEAAKKYGIITLPAVILISADGELEINCKLNLDTTKFNETVSSFFSACNIYNAIHEMKQTNGISYSEAAKRIGASYAKKDFKANTTGEVSKLLFKRTLDLPELADVNEGYLKEWDSQKIALDADKTKVNKVAKSGN